MKRLLPIVFISACLLFVANIAGAQVKIGYINTSLLVDQMPETKTIKAQIDAYSKQFMDQLTAMTDEYQKKGKIYQTGRATMTDAVRTAKETELSDLEKRISDFQNTAQQQVTAKTNELSKPLFDKIRNAVALVAKEKGYAYVLNTAQTDLIVSPPGDDLMADVKVKLGIK